LTNISKAYGVRDIGIEWRGASSRPQSLDTDVVDLLTFRGAGLVMVAVILCSKKWGINPDNVATPIAASLGDLITLSLLAAFSSFLFRHRGQRSH